MLRKKIGHLLKERRKELGLSVQEVADRLLNSGIEIAAKSIYNWEAGTRQPDADTFIYLCGIYKIDNILDYFKPDGEVKSYSSYTPQEQTLIKKYRALDERGKILIDNVINTQLEAIYPKAEDDAG